MNMFPFLIKARGRQGFSVRTAHVSRSLHRQLPMQTTLRDQRMEISDGPTLVDPRDAHLDGLVKSLRCCWTLSRAIWRRAVKRSGCQI